MTDPFAINPQLAPVPVISDVFNRRFSKEANLFVYSRTLDSEADFDGLAIRLWRTLGAGSFFNISSAYKRVTATLDGAIACEGPIGKAAAQVKHDMMLFSAHCDNVNLRLVDHDCYHDILYAYHQDGEAGDEVGSRVMTCYTVGATKFLPNDNASAYLIDDKYKAFHPVDPKRCHTFNLGDVWKQACMNTYDIPPVIHAAEELPVDSTGPRMLLVGDRFRISDFKETPNWAQRMAGFLRNRP